MSVKLRRKPPTNDVEAWLWVMGMSRHDLSRAAPLIGLEPRSAVIRNSKTRSTQWSKAERMAMTAAWLGLPEFSMDIYNLPEDSRSVILAAASVIRKAMGVSEPEPAPHAEPPK